MWGPQWKMGKHYNLSKMDLSSYHAPHPKGCKTHIFTTSTLPSIKFDLACYPSTLNTVSTSPADCWGRERRKEVLWMGKLKHLLIKQPGS